MTVVAVLEVLAFADAVGGDEQVDFAFAGEVLGTFFRARREGREDAGKILAEVGQAWSGCGRAPVTRAECRPSSFCAQPGKLAIEILGGVGEGGEDDAACGCRH